MEDTCNIEFEELDFLPTDMVYFNKKAKNIASCINCDPKLLEVLSRFLLIFIDKIDFDKRFKRWEKELEFIAESYNKTNLDKLKDELYGCFKSTKDYHIDKLRGLILEYLVENHYKPIYSKIPSKFSKGCKVIIDGVEIKYVCSEDERNNRSTVDIAGHSYEKSEFYEVKVGPNGFKDNVIKYLNILSQVANENEISQEIIVGCITLETKSKLEIKLRGLAEDYSQLKIYGRKELLDILQ